MNLNPNHQQQQHTENVVKFLLKLRNNNMQNLKNALRKLGERTQGNKDQLLLRLAQRLATEDGRQRVREYFKAEIYHELYEVDVYQNGNNNNSVYQYYRNMIPNDLQVPREPLQAPLGGPAGGPPAGAPPPQPPQSFNHQYAQPPPQQQPPMMNAHHPPAQTHQDVPPPASRANKNNSVIEIDDDDQPSSGSRRGPPPSNQVPAFNMIPETPTIPSEMKPIGTPNQPLELAISSEMHNKLKIHHIHQSANYPCLFDDNLLAGQSPVYCHCDNYNSEFIRQGASHSTQKLLTCHTCKRKTHVDCQEDNRRMRQSRIGIKEEYNCHHCQFMSLDPLSIPVATIMRPFKIAKLKADQANQKQAYMKKTTKEFIIKEGFYSQINPRRPNKSSLRIQVRCIRLDGVGFEHCFPKFGFMQVNEQRNQQDFKIPDPPNHEKKRKDAIEDITTISVQGRNTISIFQTQKDHRGFFQHPGHIVGVFLVKQIQPHDISQFIKTHRLEEPAASLTRYRSFFGGDSASGEITMIENEATEQVTINLADSILLMPIQVPARGEICTHLQCFDLDVYIEMNAKHKRWLCPFCNKRSSYVKIDPFFSHMLDAMKPLRETIHDIDDKITMNKDLSIVFTRDNGKFHLKCVPVIDEGICVGYENDADRLLSKQLAKKKEDKALAAQVVQAAQITSAVDQSLERQSAQSDQVAEVVESLPNISNSAPAEPSKSMEIQENAVCAQSTNSPQGIPIAEANSVRASSSGQAVGSGTNSPVGKTLADPGTEANQSTATNTNTTSATTDPENLSANNPNSQGVGTKRSCPESGLDESDAPAGQRQKTLSPATSPGKEAIAIELE